MDFLVGKNLEHAGGRGVLLLQWVMVMWALAHTVAASKQFVLLSASPLVHQWACEKQVVLLNSSQKTDFNCFLYEVDKGQFTPVTFVLN